MNRDTEKIKTKAIILCGGEGKRLMPLTSVVPKPLLTVGGDCVLKNIIRLLVGHGIKDIAITLGYKGEMIKEALGNRFLEAEITYYEENEPLGSAGGVKKASNFITGEDFIVICGDAWCDFDLSSAYSYFKETSCDALILTDRKPTSPLEYGLVVSTGEKRGRVTSFVEKPSWSGVCSSRVNTGMYIFKKEIIDLIPQGKSDFGFDLFTKMPESNLSVHCYDIDGYWQDIGTLCDYYDCNMQKTQGENSIGSECQIAQSTVIEKSIVHDGVMIGGGCSIKGAIIGRGSILGEQIKVEEGAVIGPYCVVGDRAVIGKGVALCEGQVVKSGEIVYNPLYKKELFTEMGIKLSKDDENAMYCLGIVLGSIYKGSTVGVMYGEGTDTARWARILMRGISCHELTLLDLGKGFSSLGAYASYREGTELTAFVKSEGDGFFIGFYDKWGVYPGANFESLVRHGSANISTENIPKHHPVMCRGGIREKYIQSLVDTVEYSLSGISFTFYTEGLFGNTLKECIKLMEGREVSSAGDFIISAKGDSSDIDIIYDGVYFDFDHIRGVCILAYSKMGIKEISLPYRSSEGLKELCADLGIRLSLYAQTAYDKRENARRSNIPVTPGLYDGAFALGIFINYALCHRLGGKDLMERLPGFITRSKRIFVTSEKKQAAVYSGEHYDKEGFLMKEDLGSVRIIAENGNNMELMAEAGTIEDASELIRRAEEFVNNFKKQ